ncbi:hypothetical protein [Lunatimonas lonarensis]|uniref:hypothetical protein n=1 Tax=Lunatimonas lonarensis TaxID=1232681 RepID=UPI0012DE73E4|nr:hypothetical protein [Lunatimonas lonarensis]
MTLQKATVAAGVVAMSVGLFNSFDAEAEGGSTVDCFGMYEDGTTHITFCNGCVERRSSWESLLSTCTP